MNNLTQIIQQYKADTESVYNTWFVDNDEYLGDEERNKFKKNILKCQKEIQEEKLAENLLN